VPAWFPFGFSFQTKTVTPAVERSMAMALGRARAAVAQHIHVGGEVMQKRVLATHWKSRDRARLHGMSQVLRSAPDRPELISFIRAAVERGVTFFDTAEVYGHS